MFTTKRGEIMMNLMNLRLQDLLIERIVAIAGCGLFDGIMIDGFNENATSFVGRHHYPHTDEKIIAATTRILRGVRGPGSRGFSNTCQR